MQVLSSLVLSEASCYQLSSDSSTRYAQEKRAKGNGGRDLEKEEKTRRRTIRKKERKKRRSQDEESDEEANEGAEKKKKANVYET